MIHHFPILILCLVTFICLFNPTLSAGDCAKCGESLDQTDESNPAIELPICQHAIHKNCLIKQLEGNEENKCLVCQEVIYTRGAIEKLHNLHPQKESDGALFTFVKIIFTNTSRN